VGGGKGSFWTLGNKFTDVGQFQADNLSFFLSLRKKSKSVTFSSGGGLGIDKQIIRMRPRKKESRRSREIFHE